MKKAYARPESRWTKFRLIENLAEDEEIDPISGPGTGTGGNVGGGGTGTGAEEIPGGL